VFYRSCFIVILTLLLTFLPNVFLNILKKDLWFPSAQAQATSCVYTVENDMVLLEPFEGIELLCLKANRQLGHSQKIKEYEQQFLIFNCVKANLQFVSKNLAYGGTFGDLSCHPLRQKF